MKRKSIQKSDSLIVDSSCSAEEILTNALDIAEEILRCGGEPHRIEDTVTRICMAYGCDRSDTFALPAVINSTVTMPDGTKASEVRRVYATENNMTVLDEMNNLSRKVCSGAVPLKNIKNEIQIIKSKKTYPKFFLYLASVLAAGGFAVFFGGNLPDACVASVAGFVITFLNFHKINRVNSMVHTAVVSFLSAVVCLGFHHFGIGENIDMIMIGTIMLLIPGLSFGNAIRDLFFGDTISGIMQLVQAILLAVTIAIGFVVAMMLFGGLKL